jgi:hypothetical protein
MLTTAFLLGLLAADLPAGRAAITPVPIPSPAFRADLQKTLEKRRERRRRLSRSPRTESGQARLEQSYQLMLRIQQRQLQERQLADMAEKMAEKAEMRRKGLLCPHCDKPLGKPSDTCQCRERS